MKLNISTLLTVAALVCTGVNAGLSESDKNNLLKLHKNARNSVGASDMKSISWSDSLANDAQKYADSCPGLTHSTNRNGQGENISYGGSNVSSLFNLWIDEKSDFLKSGYASNFKGINFNGKAIGHYSQVVWAANTQVGCGIADCNGSKNLICRYGTGNHIGEKVYNASNDEKKAEKIDEDKKEEPKPTTTVRKVTTTTTVRKTTTTTTTVKRTTTTTTKATTHAPVTTKPIVIKTTTKPVIVATTIQKKPLLTTVKLPLVATTKPSLIATTTTVKLPIVNTRLPIGVTTTVKPIATQTIALNQIVGQTKTNGNVANAANSNTANTKSNNAANVKSSSNNTEIKSVENDQENSGKTGTVVTGVAVTGSVLGAAAAFAFVKKNPKQYQQIKRSISRSATSVKRGASVVTRKLTTKRAASNVAVQEPNTGAYDINYRVDFAEAMSV